jgi:hypothetical protein
VIRSSLFDKLLRSLSAFSWLDEEKVVFDEVISVAPEGGAKLPPSLHGKVQPTTWGVRRVEEAALVKIIQFLLKKVKDHKKIKFHYIRGAKWVNVHS